MANPQDFMKQLIEAAIQARRQAYAPYSNFSVGAAILGADERIHVGCNVENASYGMTICAERNAVGAMLTAGCTSIAAIAVALEGDGSPCGACRQVLAEFGEGFSIYLVTPSDGSIVRQWTINQLLPNAFRLRNASEKL